MDFQEQFFKDQIKIIHEARCAEEDSFELLQQKEREKVEQSNSNTTSTEDYKRRYCLYPTTRKITLACKYGRMLL